MTKIQAGDVVRRTGNSTQSTIYGSVYTVAEVNWHDARGVALVGIYSGNGGLVRFAIDRFEFVSRPAKVKPKMVEYTSVESYDKRLIKGHIYVVKATRGKYYDLVDGPIGVYTHRFKTISEEKEVKMTTATNAPRKFWMVASDIAEQRFHHHLFRNFGGAPYKKYYVKQGALNAITSMTSSSRNSYYLLESVEHHAPVSATPTTCTSL